MSAGDKSIKFPAKHYVGFQARPTVDDVPLGFMTPDGDDAAAKKRKATVDTWASGYGRTDKKQMPAQVFENKPLTGFKLGRNVRHGYGWGQGNVKWRIEDPRGFELEITSPNLAQLMGFCTIEKGEIQEQCIWARLGAENILVPVNSEVYENTVRNTERVSKKVALKDLKRGDKVVLHNGDEGTYYGAFYVINTVPDQVVDADGNRLVEFVLGKVIKEDPKRRHVFLMQTPAADGMASHKFLKAIGSPKLSEVYEGDREFTHEEAEKLVNDMMAEGVSLNESTNDYGCRPKGVSIEPLLPSVFTQTEEMVDIKEIIAQAAVTKGANYYNYYYVDDIAGGLLLMDLNGEKVTISCNEYSRAIDAAPGGKSHVAHYRDDYWMLNLGVVDWDYFQANDRFKLKEQAVKGYSYYSSHRTEGVRIQQDPRTVPTLATRFKMTATTTAGTEIIYYR